MIEVINANFLTSAPSLKEAMPEGLPEVAFLGRSNVGKSSLINALTNNKNLAKSSSTPGKTRLINFFDVEYRKSEDKKEDIRRNVYFVDLPGFGYARVSKTEKETWQKNLTHFLAKRLSLRLFLLLIDSRHPHLEIDESVKEYVLQNKKGDQKLLCVFTKTDKLNQKELGKLKRDFPDALMVSVLKKRGIEKLNQEIFRALLGDNL